jgi:hypothetical protein
MKRITVRGRKITQLPIAWREAGYAALQADAADTSDDRVSEDIFDAEDEWTEVGAIVHGMNRWAN